MVESEPLVEQGASDPAAQPARIEITTDDPIEITVEDNELPLSLDLPTWLVLAASGPALKLAHLLVLLHHQAPADRQITQGLLAALLGKSEDRVAAYTKELVAIGWLTVTKRRVRGWQVPNEYRYRNRPPAGHVTAGTVEDLMAIVDARSSKPAGQPVPAKTRVRTRKNAGTDPAVEQTRRSARTRKNTGPYPQKRGSSKELPSCNSDLSIDRSIEVPPSEPTTTEPSELARELVRTLAYGRHGMPAAGDVDVLAALVDAAAGQGLTLPELRTHCQAAISRATTAVVPYLVGALSTDRLPVPTPRPPAADTTMPLVCGQCDARPGDPVSARVVWLDTDRTRSTRCPRCHPGAIPGPERAQGARTASYPWSLAVSTQTGRTDEMGR